MSNGISGLLSYRVDLDKPAVMTPLREPLVTEDKMAYGIQLTAVSKGQPVSLAGCGAVGYMIRADGATVTTDTAQGTDDGVTLWLPEACYTVPGRYSLVVKLTDSQTRRTVLWLEGNVARSRTDAIVDPENVVPSLDALLQQIAVMEAATSAANTAATAATTAAEQASSNATAAGNAASAASAAATAINSMTAQASALPAGSTPTAAVTEAEDGYKVISFGIPKGDTGATPALSIGTVTTGEPGTEASASITGTAEAPVLDLTIPRGQTGSIDSLTVNGQTADATGNISITGEDIHVSDTDSRTLAEAIGDAGTGGTSEPEVYIGDGTLPEDSSYVLAVDTSGTADTQAQISDVAGLPEALSQRDRVRNLLDNSYWEDASRIVIQNGWTSGSTINAYTIFIAQWKSGASSITPVIGDDGITIADGVMMQYLDRLGGFVGGKVTIACKFADGLTMAGVCTVTNNPSWTDNGTFTYPDGRKIRLGNPSTNSWFVEITPNGNAVKWAVLYPGEYTADTLPTHVSKGYVAELLECKRYYNRLAQPAGTPLAYGVTYGTGNARFKIPMPVPMRVAPTITVGKGVGNLRVLCNGTQYTATAIGGVYVKDDGILFQVTCDGIPSAHPAILVFNVEDVLTLNAEL